MSTRLVRSLLAALALVGAACTSDNVTSSGGTGGAPGQGGTAGGGQSATGGAQGTGGAASHGGSEGGMGGVNGTGGSTVVGSGGAGTGGRLGSGGSGGSGIAGSMGFGGATTPSAGGTPALGGTTGTGAGGSAGSSGTSADVVPSAGCGKTKTLSTTAANPITLNGAQRKYFLFLPAGYDNSHPYRLVFAFAESGSSAQSVVDRKYFSMATLDSKSTTIFAAPDAVGSAGSWSKTDVDLTDAILAQLEGDLCIDKTRIFATGFSFGGAMSMALACTRADVFRGVAFFSGADLTGSCPTTLTKPIAYYASQASQDANGMDPTNPMTGERKQAQFAAVNGCTAEPTSTNFPAAGQPHTCTNYKGCSAGHPTEYCVFNGPHGWEPKDPGQSTSWDAPEAWKFITQF
jgi:poly(3-hydroxybutyrate) depolymerase